MEEDYKMVGAGIIFCVVIFLGIFVCLLGFDYVDASHLGVMNQMGSIKGVMTPGVRWTGLFTHVYTYDMRLRKVHVDMEGQQYAPDKTGQPVYASIDVNYRLKRDSVQTLYQNVGPDNVVEEQLNIVPLITEGFKRATVKYEALEILDKREEVAHLAEQNIKDRFPVEYFEIDQVVISNLHYSDQFQKAIDDKKTAIQLTAVAQQNLEKVKFEQAQILEGSKVEAQKLQLQKQQITDKLNTQKMLEKWNGQLPQYLIITPESQGLFLQLAKGEMSSGNEMET